MGGQPGSGYTKIIIGLQKKKMANWDHIISRRISMGRLRSLCLALNAARRRREEEEERRPGVNPFMGRGIIPRFRQWEGVPGRGSNNMFRGRSRSFPALPQNAIRTQPHAQPCYLTLGYRSQSQPVAPNPQVAPNIFSIPPSHPNPTPPCPCLN